MLELVVQRYLGKRGEDIRVLFHNHIYFLLLSGEISCGGPGCDCDIYLTLRANHEEDKFPGVRDVLPALLGRDQGNNTMRPWVSCTISCSK
jgi:hypothetical protein